MEGQTNGQGVDASVGQSTPPPTPAPPPAPMPPTNTMAVGGDSSGGSNFFKELDWVEVGFGALGALALYFVIYYYKNKVVFEKMEKSAIQKQLDLIKNDLEQLKSSEVNEPTSGGF